MCDALAANIAPEFATVVGNCLAHGRRGVVEVLGHEGQVLPLARPLLVSPAHSGLSSPIPAPSEQGDRRDLTPAGPPPMFNAWGALRQAS